MSNATPPADVSTKPTQRFRRLRIAVSVFFAVLTVALGVLWVRSYWWTDSIGIGYWGNHTVWARSIDGTVIVGTPWTPKPHVSIKTFPTEEWRNIPARPSFLGFRWGKSMNWVPVVPLWFFMLIFGAIAFVTVSNRPLREYRFSLRTMLIAMTLFAVVLGLVCYAVR
jgi:hypothetical protein